MTGRASGTAVLAGLVLVAGWWWFEVSDLPERDIPVLLTGVFLALLVPSVLGQHRRPSDPLPVALAVTGLAVFVSYFRFLPQPWVATIGAVTWLASPLVLLWGAGFLLPGIRRPGLLVGFGGPLFLACISVGVSGPRTVEDGPDSVRASTWATSGEPAPVRQLNPLAWLADDDAPIMVWLVSTAWVAAVLVWVWRRSFAGSRRRERAMLVLVTVATAAAAATAWPERLAPGSPSPIHGRWYFDSLVLLPALTALVAGCIAVWFEVVRPRLRYASMQRMQVDGMWSSERLSAHLRHTLGDPSARLLLADPHRPGSWLDEGGATDALSPDEHRAATVVERDGRPVAALEYDATLADRPELVELVAASVGLALEGVQLAAVAARQAAEARGAATQLLVVAETAREELRGRVLDGPDRELAAVAALLERRPLPLVEIHDGLRRATAAVREVSGALTDEATPGRAEPVSPGGVA